MEPAGINVQLRFHSRFLQMADIVCCLAVKWLDVPHEGVAGRQAAVIRPSGGGSVTGDKVRPPGLPQIALPGLMIPFRIPVGGMIVHRGGSVPVVQHGIQGHLKGDVHFPPVMGQHAQGGGHAAPGALAPHHELIRPEADLLCVFFHIEERSVAVLQSGGIGVLFGKTIIRGDQNRPEFHHQG